MGFFSKNMNVKSIYHSSALRFLLGYGLILFLLFQLSRILFISFNYPVAVVAGSGNILGSFWHGMKMDLSMTCYLLFPMIFLLIISVIMHRVYIFPFRIYNSIILFFLLFLFTIDIGLYHAWGFRLDATPLKYFDHPKEVWASISYLPVFRILLLLVIVYLIFVTFINRWLSRHLSQVSILKNKLIDIAILLLISGLLIIPMRGGFQLAPLNQSSVYFSKNNFANQAALNAPWNLMYSLNHNIESTTNPFIVTAGELPKKVIDSLYSSGGNIQQFIDTLQHPVPNVIIVIWESFTRKVIDASRKGIVITPGFNQLKTQGIYFSDIYATGDRTDKGIVAVLSGYPSQPTTSIVKTPGKAAKLPMLSKLFVDRGYHSAFYYGGEPEFANMKAYLLQGGFDQFITIDDFPESSRNSKWGAHDDIVMKKLFGDLQHAQQPFFTTWLTLSSHEPFETPVKTVISGNDDESLFLNAMHYSDSCLYNFVQQCSRQSWWKNTVMVITPDHGCRLPMSVDKVDDFKASLLMLGGALTQKGITIYKTGSQVDIPAILLSQLGISSKPFRWSRNVLDSSTHPWAYFSFNNGFGFVDPAGSYIFDNTGKQVIEQHGNITERDILAGRIMQQMTFQDYLEK